MKNRNWLVAAGFTFVAAAAFAQKSVETSAAVEFKNTYQDKLAKGDFDAAKKSLIKAKGFVDQAAAHADTKDSPKTLWFKGDIYSNFLILGEAAKDSNFVKEAGADPMATAIAAYKKGYEVSDKYDQDILESIDKNKAMLQGFAEMMYTQKLYKEALEVYDTQTRLSAAVGAVDSASYFNGGISADQAGLYDIAADHYKKCAEIGYQVPFVYKKIALSLINAGKNDEAIGYVQKAIDKYPNDEYLYFYLGTMYIDLKDEAKATENLSKAVALNPKFNEAQYQLGKHYLDIATRLRDEAGQLPQNQQKKYDAMLAESILYYERASAPLEAYIQAVPNEKAVLICLYQINKALKKPEKATEYKKRADAL